MSNPPPPQFLTQSVEQDGAAYDVTLIWVNAVNYDKVIVRWDPGPSLTPPTPGSAELDGATQSYTIKGFQPGSSWTLQVEGGTNTAGSWSYSGFVATTATFPAHPQLLLYRQVTGAAWTTPILAGPTFGTAKPLGTWQPNWTQLAPFQFQGGHFLLRYKSDGSLWGSALSDIGDGSGLSTVGEPLPALDLDHKPLIWSTVWTHIMCITPPFTSDPFVLAYAPPDNSTQGGGRNYFQSAPILSPSVIGFGSVVKLGKGVEDQNWSQIVPFMFDNFQFLLFYNESTGDAYTAPIVSPTEIGDLSVMGVWEPDWALITAFVFDGNSFFLLYRRTGSTWTAPIESATQVGQAANIGGWENDWALVLPFN